MASADFSRQILFQPGFLLCFRPSVRPPGVRRFTFVPFTCHIYTLGSGQLSGLVWLATSPPLKCLVCGSCSSGRNFASGFLQIPSRDGHPCPWLALGRYLPVEGTFTPVWGAMPGALAEWPTQWTIQADLRAFQRSAGLPS